MRIVIERVLSAEIVINGDSPIKMDSGLVALVGFCHDDNEKTVDIMTEKMLSLRVFDDETGHLNHSLSDVGGQLMVVSNFTLYADCKKGRRPSFTGAAHPSIAKPLYEYMLRKIKISKELFLTGEFGANMQITLCNDGPVTIILDSAEILK